MWNQHFRGGIAGRYLLSLSDTAVCDLSQSVSAAAVRIHRIHDMLDFYHSNHWSLAPLLDTV